LEDTDFVIDTVDAFLAILTFLNNNLSPFITDNSFDRYFVDTEILLTALAVLPQEAQCFDHRTVSFVVAAKFQCIK
jgi:hypothetical protein